MRKLLGGKFLRVLAGGALLISSGVLAVPAQADSETGVAFAVTDLQIPGVTQSVKGTLFQPSCAAHTVVLLQHGLSYTRRAWNVAGYSVVDKLVAAGYAVVTIDRLGYGESTMSGGDGSQVSSESYADMTNQIVAQLREGFDHVVLGGHSAGAEVAELTAGLFGPSAADAVLALGYHHFPSPQIVTDFFTGDIPRSLTSPDEEFLGSPSHRAAMFFKDFPEGADPAAEPANANADPAVIADDAAHEVPTPSGEIQTIGKQPSRYVMANVTVPVFLQLADSDRLFEAQYATEEALLFARSPEVDVDLVPDAGHTFMLHHSGPAAAGRMAEWLVAHPTTSPACGS
jgi:pimeloyl-ACP methyl ester carboxylesterase